MHWFDEHHDAFKGFSLHYHDEVRPELRLRDKDREAALRRGYTVGGAVLAVALGLAAAVMLTSRDLGAALGLAFFGAAGAFGAFHWMLRHVKRKTKLTLVEAAARFIGWTYTADVGAFDFAPFTDNFLLPAKYDRFSLEDSLSGTAHGAQFQTVEATLEVRRRDPNGNDHYKTVFQGQLIQIDFPTRMFGRTVVLRDKGLFNAKRRGDMKRVGLASPRFEKLFEAYGTDQVEARVILDPVFMQQMIDLEESVSGKNIRFAFTGNDLLIAVETKDQFEAGSMRRSLDNPDAMQKILDEIGTLFDIADSLLAQPATRSTSQAR